MGRAGVVTALYSARHDRRGRDNIRQHTTSADICDDGPNCLTAGPSKGTTRSVSNFRDNGVAKINPFPILLQLTKVYTYPMTQLVHCMMLVMDTRNCSTNVVTAFYIEVTR